MALMTFKPTSPGRRSAVRVVTPDLHKGAPFAALVEKKSKSGGRNHHGRITTRHIGGGHKQNYRTIDVAQQRDVRGAVGIVFDPLHARRNAFLVALEVDDAVMLLVATADVAGGDAAVVVAAAALALLLDQRFQRAALVQAGGGDAHHGAAARRGRLESL